MDCCAHLKGLNDVFDERRAQDELRSYLKRGLDRHARRIVAALAARGLVGASILEVGGGIGGLHIELLRGGAASATDVDVAAAYIAVAQSLAERLGLRQRVEYRQADFAGAADELPSADIVVLHRVVCCYPDMPTLITAAAQHAGRLLALSFPHHAWYMRLGGRLINASLWLQRSGYRFYVHDPAAIGRVAAAAGLTPVQEIASWPWRIALFERQPTTGDRPPTTDNRTETS